MAITEFKGKYRFLSNFYLLPDGKSSEHYFQAAKSSGADQYARVMAASSPMQAKRLGRQVKVRADWDQVKVSIMASCLRMKFSYRPLADMLLATTGQALVEGNHWHDNFWGVCSCDRPTCQGTGKNILGHLLVMERDHLRRQQEAAAPHNHAPDPWTSGPNGPTKYVDECDISGSDPSAFANSPIPFLRIESSPEEFADLKSVYAHKQELWSAPIFQARYVAPFQAETRAQGEPWPSQRGSSALSQRDEPSDPDA